MSKIITDADLHSFADDISKGIQKGGGQKPPLGIRAKDLDDNFKKTAVIDDDGDFGIYKAKYTSEGTVLDFGEGIRIGVIRNGEFRYYDFLATPIDEAEE